MRKFFEEAGLILAWLLNNICKGVFFFTAGMLIMSMYACLAVALFFAAKLTGKKLTIQKRELFCSFNEIISLDFVDSVPHRTVQVWRRTKGRILRLVLRCYGYQLGWCDLFPPHVDPVLAVVRKPADGTFQQAYLLGWPSKLFPSPWIFEIKPLANHSITVHSSLIKMIKMINSVRKSF